MMSAARRVASLRDSKHMILHLVNPNAVPWRTLFSAVATILDVPLVPYSTWLDKVKLSDGEVPAAYLLSTFQKMKADGMGNGHEALGITRLAYGNAEESLPGFNDEKALCDQDVNSWMNYWQKHAVL
jgi:hypothetical protein